MASMDVLLSLTISLLFINTVNSNFASKYGVLRNVLYSNLIACNHSKILNLSVSELEVYFYDFQNNFNVSYKIDNALKGLTSVYNLDITRKLIFFVPGYHTSLYKNSPEIIRQTFRDVPNVYLIIIDHSAYTFLKEGKQASYENSVMYSYYIGQALGKFLADLRNFKRLPSQNIHCIGHSLGSQILGYAGIAYFVGTNERIWRITGIDPAGPCFSNSFVENQLRSGCADYVEVYHCSAGTLGTSSVLADVDFFFNDEGRVQPHCRSSFIFALTSSESARCSHKACVVFWSKTVHNPGWYLAWRCNSYKDFVNGKCAGNEVAIAGYSNPGNVSGVLYVSTSAYGVF